MSTIDFHSLAKTELHCHLDGSLSLPTIRQLATPWLILTSLLAMRSSSTMSPHLPTVRIYWTIWRPLTTFVPSFKPRKP